MAKNVTVGIFVVETDIASLCLGDVMEPEIAWMTQMKLAALIPPAIRAFSSVRVMGPVSHTPGYVTVIWTARTAQMNSSSIALGEHARVTR